MRVVSLACSNTEIVAALGCSDLLVGVDSHSDYPEGVVDRLPRMGPDLEIDIARVAALAPDLVLASLTVPGHETVIEGLEAAGIPFIAPSPLSLDDVYVNIVEIAHLLGVEERGRELVREMKAELAPSGGRRAGERAPSILVQWWPKPVIAPGRESWATDVIRAAGGRNPLELDDVKSRRVEDEELAAIAPDAIVISWCGVHPDKYRPDVIYGKEGWQDVPAIRNRRVFSIPEAYLGRPGPRLVDGVRALRKIVEEMERGRHTDLAAREVSESGETRC